MRKRRLWVGLRSIKQDCDFGLRLGGVRPFSTTIGTDLGEKIRPTQLRRRLQHAVSLILRFLHAVPPRPDDHRNFRSLKEIPRPIKLASSSACFSDKSGSSRAIPRWRPDERFGRRRPRRRPSSSCCRGSRRPCLAPCWRSVPGCAASMSGRYACEWICGIRRASPIELLELQGFPTIFLSSAQRPCVYRPSDPAKYRRVPREIATEFWRQFRRRRCERLRGNARSTHSPGLPCWERNDRANLSWCSISPRSRPWSPPHTPSRR